MYISYLHSTPMPSPFLCPNDSNLCTDILKCLSPVQEYIFFRSSVNAFLMASRLIFIAAVTNPDSGVQGSGSSFTLVGISNLSSFPCLATCASQFYGNISYKIQMIWQGQARIHYLWDKNMRQKIFSRSSKDKNPSHLRMKTLTLPRELITSFSVSDFEHKSAKSE